MARMPSCALACHGVPPAISRKTGFRRFRNTQFPAEPFLIAPRDEKRGGVPALPEYNRGCAAKDTHEVHTMRTTCCLSACVIASIVVTAAGADKPARKPATELP